MSTLRWLSADVNLDAHTGEHQIATQITTADMDHFLPRSLRRTQQRSGHKWIVPRATIAPQTFDMPELDPKPAGSMIMCLSSQYGDSFETEETRCDKHERHDHQQLKKKTVRLRNKCFIPEGTHMTCPRQGTHCPDATNSTGKTILRGS